MTTSSTPFLLPGQAAAPDGPVDLTVMYAIHHGFRRDLGDFVAAVERLGSRDTSRGAALAGRWGLFERILHNHHTEEDELVWPLIRARATQAGDRDALDLLDEMEAEHEAIDPLLAACAAGFNALAARHHTVRDHLAENLRDLREHLDAHLAHEERDAIAVLQRHVTAALWKPVDQQLRRRTPPRDALLLVPWVYKGLDDRARSVLSGHAGPIFGVLGRLGARRFRRLDAAAFSSAVE
jgi:iron-sulfur cluster repair protein YtfE (RIC family)